MNKNLVRVLKFIVDDRGVRKDPACDFSGLAPGTGIPLRAEFSFSKEWDNTTRVVGFWQNGVECEPQVLIDGYTCAIPGKIMAGHTFELQILGRKNTAVMKTNMLQVRLYGGAR